MPPLTTEPEPLHDLVQALVQLPGIGERTARRMAYYLLQHNRSAAENISASITKALGELRHCQRCNSFSMGDICAMCSDPRRDHSVLCVVETAADLNMIETSHGYHGLYYVLMGNINPLEGMGAKALSIERLLQRILQHPIEEVILATNFTAEGETTAHYLGNILKEQPIKVSRIARGIPSGSELEYVDAGTIAWALNERK